MIKILSILGFTSSFILFYFEAIQIEALVLINIFFAIIFFYKTENNRPSNIPIISGSKKELSKDDLQKIFIDELEDIIIILNRFNIIVYNNKVAIENFGADLEGKHIGSEIRIPELLEAIDQIKIDKKQKKLEVELNIPVFKFYKVSLAIIKSDQILILIRDFTEMRKSQNMRSDFIANASHELRTPLVSLKGFLETISDSAKDDPSSQKKFINIMKEEAGKMERLLDDLMSLSRIELQEHIRPKDKVNIIELIENIILLNSNKAKEKNISVKLKINDNEKFVIGDKEKLSAVFLNLLDNAIKYSHNSSIVEIRNSDKKPIFNNYTSISVIDNGVGIAQEDIHRVTERFFRAENIKKLKISGTGLGLAIVKHIVNQHRGEFKIYSNLNKGSEFEVQLPLA
jgi:two-component system phosphate regulon sensor histidine kinase PhoR